MLWNLCIVFCLDISIFTNEFVTKKYRLSRLFNSFFLKIYESWQDYFLPFFKGKKSKLLTDFTFLLKKENDSFYIPENGKTITRPVLFIDSRLNEVYLGGNDA